MAEVAGLILAVIQITSKCASLAYDYGKNVKHAKDDCARITKELENFKGVLEQLENLALRAKESGAPCKILKPVLVSVLPLYSPSGVSLLI